MKRVWAFLALVLLLVFLSYESVCRGISGLLTNAAAPERADVAVVLAGDYSGSRMTKGAEMVTAGYVPKAIVSGPQGFYGSYECDLAIAWAERNGMKREWFDPFPNQARSTAEEAAIFAPELRKRGVKKFLLVTTTFHTARATRIFRAAMPDIQVIPVAAKESQFNQDTWWKEREGQKAVFFEVSKTIAGYLGL
jgi:uncharacterized SAM-binding protein YcdF (DUF218 family)